MLASVAGLPVVARFAEHDRGEWERLWQLNLRAPMALTQALVGAMQERGWGRLVYVASDSAPRRRRRRGRLRGDEGRPARLRQVDRARGRARPA